MRSYLSELSMRLLDAGFEVDQVNRIINEATILATDFHLVEKQTAIIPYTGDENAKIIKQFLATKLLEGKSKKSVAMYGRRLELFFQAVKKPYKDVNKNDIKAYLAMFASSGRSASYVDTLRSIISAFFNWLADEDYLVKSPSKSVKPIKQTKKIPEAFSQVDLENIRSACDTVKKRMLVEMLLSSGARVAELVGLDRSDVDFERRRLHIRHGKGDKERFTYFSPVASSYLKKYLETRKDDGEYLIANNRGERITEHGVEQVMRDLGKAAGVKKVHPHRFRRTLATTLARRNMAVQKIKELLGHEDISTTMRYICVTQEDVANAYEMCA